MFFWIVLIFTELRIVRFKKIEEIWLLFGECYLKQWVGVFRRLRSVYIYIYYYTDKQTCHCVVADLGVFASDIVFLVVTHPLLLISRWIGCLRIDDDLSYP
jgi:hypothetical protein